MAKLAQRTQGIKPSVTLAIAAKAAKLRAEGIDVANFSAGEPDFDTPEHIKAAAIEALRDLNARTALAHGVMAGE